MPEPVTSPLPTDEDLTFQEESLQEVSRTFALTIPQLPAGLDTVVGNAYLLCRIADTIEDDSGLSGAQKREFSDRFIALLHDGEDAQAFARELHARLTASTQSAEHALVLQTPRVLRITRGFPRAQQAQLERCVRIMSQGMAEFQNRSDHAGLPDLAAFDRYCYRVAGVVGELLTELFCDYSPHIARHRHRLLPLSISFGAALQMTNILKDVWEDRQRGACWLPRDLFARHGCDLRHLEHNRADAAFRAAMREMIGIAHGHVRNAMGYLFLIPAHETGIRRFCLWALGMAVLTLRKVNANRGYTSGQRVKISRAAVRRTIALSNRFCANDTMLRTLLWLTTRGLPPANMPTAQALAACRGEAAV